MGIYAGGPAWIDYQMPKIVLGDKFPDKKEWWANLKTAREADPRKHDIYIIYPGVRKGRASLEQCKQRIDAWLKPEPGAETYPGLIPAISLSEEHALAQKPMLEALARHVRNNHGIPVFQWYFGILPPDPDLTADGWIFDFYFREYPVFRRNLMYFLSMDKPVICVLWASDPAWPGYAKGRFPNTEALMNNVEDQFKSCMEFNVSTALFAVAGPGALFPWLNSHTPDMVGLRNWIRVKQA